MNPSGTFVFVSRHRDCFLAGVPGRSAPKG